MAPDFSHDDSVRLGVQGGSWTVSLLLSVVIIAGMATIPMSATEDPGVDQHSTASSARDPSSPAR